MGHEAKNKLSTLLSNKGKTPTMKYNPSNIGAALMLAAALLPSTGVADSIPAHPSDARFNTNSAGTAVASGPVSSTFGTVFIGRAYYSNELSHMVVPFQLPDLGDGTISDVSVTYRVAGGEIDESPLPIDVNLFALPGTRPFSTPVTTDVYGTQNHTQLGTLIKGNFLTAATAPGTVVSTGSGETATLTSWLNGAYADGLNAGNFVFMRLSPAALVATTVGTYDESEYGYGFEISAAGPFGGSPVISYTFTPAPANKPVILNLTASPTGVSAGGSSMLNWSSTNADTLTLDPGGVDVTGLTSYSVTPAATTQYTLTAQSSGGTRTRSVTVAIQSGITQRGTATSITQTGNVTGAASLVMAKPAGVATGDLMIAVITKNNGGNSDPQTTTPPSGWTAIGQGIIVGGTTHRAHGSAFYKVAVADDASVSSYSFTLTTNANLGNNGQNGSAGTLVAFAGVDPVTPFSVTPGSLRLTTTASTTATADSITTTTAFNPIAMLSMASTGANSSTNPSNFATATSPGALTPIATAVKNGTSSAVAWGVQPSSGATGNGTATLSASARSAAILLALNESPKPSFTSFTSSPAVIRQGAAATISWSASKTTGVTIDGIGSFGPSGSVTVNPSTTTTYTIRASNLSGESVSTTTVAVLSPGPYRYYRMTPTAIREPVFNLLYTSSFHFTRDGVRVPAASVTSTNSSNPAVLDSATATAFYSDNPGPGKPFRAVVYDMGADSANWSVNGTRIGSNTINSPGFDMVSWRIEGSHDSANWVEVTQQVNYSTPVISSTLSPNIPFNFAPSVVFTATPSDIPLGGSTTLSWSVGGGVSVSIAGIGDNLALSGTQVVTPAQGSTTYTLTAANGVYGTTVATTTVIAGASSTSLDLANASFESDVNSDAAGSFGAGARNTLNGWTVVGRLNSAYPDTQQVAVGWANVAPAQGTQALALMAGASVGQLTDLNWADLNVGDQLKFTIAAGDRAYNPDGNPRWADQSFIGFSNGMAGIAAGSLSNVVGRSADIVTPPGGYKSGTMGDVSYTYTLGSDEFLLSGKVGIFIASLGYRDSAADGLDAPGAQSFWDNVRVEVVRAPGPRILSFTSTATSIIAGAEATLSWSVENATSVTITGLGTVPATGTATVAPTASGGYILTATNAAGSQTRSLDLFVTGPVVYRYFRFSPLQVRVPYINGSAMGVSISEFQLYNGSTLITGATASAPTSIDFTGAEPAKALDANFNTYWSDKWLQPLVLDYGTGVLATSYRFATGNSPNRDPLSWKLEGSLDGITWYLIDQRTGQTVTETRGEWHTTLNTNVNPAYPVVAGAPVVNSFTASPATIGETASSTLSWEVSGADSVELVGTGSVAAAGSQVVSPRSSINYYILARNASGFTFESARVEVTRLPRGGIAADASDANFETSLSDGSIVDGPYGASFFSLDLGRFTGSDSLNHIVIPFKLPDLGPGGFLEAELSVNVLAGELGAAGRIPIQLFAIPGARVTSATLATDVVNGAATALTNGYLLKSGFLNTSTLFETFAHTGETGLTADGLGYWLNEAYANGANAGKYVFIRLSPDALSVAEGSGFAISSGDDPDYAPQLSYVFNPAGVPAPPIISNFATNTAILVAGNSAVLQWTTFGTTGVTIDGVPVASSGSLAISPTTNTTYTLAATNANGTRTVQTQQVVVLPGSYRYLRYSTLKIRPVPNVNVMGDVRLSLGEFQISDENGPIPAATAGVVDFNGYGGGAVLVNGVPNDSWYGRINGGFTIDYRTFVRPTSYRIGTGSATAAVYNPVSWLLEGSLDGNTWTVVDQRTDVGAAIPELQNVYSDFFYLTAAPEIVSFAPNAGIIPTGGSATLSWNVTDAETVSIDNGIGVIDATGSVAVSPSVSTIYTLTATGNGITRTAYARVDVDSGTGLLVSVFDDLPYTSFYELINPISRLNSETVAGTFIQSGDINYTRVTMFDRQPTDLPGLTSHNSFALRFTGWFNIATDGPGTYTFGTASEGGSTIFLDLNYDGDFDDPGELIVNNNLVDAIQSAGKVGTVNLTGSRVRIAIGYWDNYGLNDKLQVRFKKGTGLGYADLNPVNGTSGHFTTVDPHPPFKASTFTKAGTVFTLVWDSQPGATYTIEGTSNLADWLPLSAGIASQGASTTAIIDLASTPYADAPKFFMRVKAGSGGASN
jgi:hypothetical protein